MKVNKNTLLVVAAVVLFAAAGKIALISKARQDMLAGLSQKAATARDEIARIEVIKKAVFAGIPVGNGRLDKIGTVVTRGSVALYNLAQDHNLSVGILSIDNTAQGDIALDSIAKSLPMTNNSIRRITLLLKISFSNLSYLHDFIEKISDTGGYLSDIKIKGNGAALTVKFIGD